MRYSIRTLLIAAALFAGVFATLAMPRGLAVIWASLVVTALDLWLLASLLLMLVLRERRRAFWTGVFLFGVGWLLLTSQLRLAGLDIHGATIRPTTRLLAAIHEQASGTGSQRSFVNVGDAAAACLLALVGGRLATWAFDRREEAGETDRG